MIKINDDFIVEVDDKCMTLKEYAGISTKTGKERYGIAGYFTSWEGVFNEIIKLSVVRKVNAKSVVTLEELKKIVQDTKKEIKSILSVIETK